MVYPANEVRLVLAAGDSGNRRESNPNEHRHLDHGYAVTSHSSQGLTAERVLVHADTSVHPDLLNSRFAYVSISRAGHEVAGASLKYDSASHEQM